MKLVISESINGVTQVTEKESVLIISDFDTGASAVPLSTVTAKGSLIAGTANATVSELVVGANGTVLMADSAEPTGLKFGSPSGSFGAVDAENRTLSGTLTLTNADAYVQFCDPGGSDRQINLPAEGVNNHPFIIANTADAQETLTVKDDGGATIAIITQGKACLLSSSNTRWAMIGAGYKQLWVAGWKPTLTNGCAYPAQIEMPTNKNVYDYCAFGKASISYAYVNVPLPDDYSGGDVYASFYWFHPATTTNFGVVWGIQGVAVGDGGAMDAPFGTAQYVTDTGGTTNYKYISGLTSVVTIAGSPAPRKLVQFRVLRKVDDASDTLAVSAYFEGVMIWYPVA